MHVPFWMQPSCMFTVTRMFHVCEVHVSCNMYVTVRGEHACIILARHVGKVSEIHAFCVKYDMYVNTDNMHVV